MNPEHLEPVTHAENMRRASLDACRRAGHPYTPENTYRRPDGHRECRACRDAKRPREYEARKRQRRDRKLVAA